MPLFIPLTVKKAIKGVLGRMGYSVSRLEKLKPKNMDMYFQIYGKNDVLQKKFYNIGSGTFRHPAWTNIDYKSDWYAENEIDINYNLLDCKPLPLHDSIANAFYSSHTIEHITDEAAQNMFNEIYRVLKKGGYLRLVAPNIDLSYKTIKNNDRYFWQEDIDIYSKKENMDRVGIAIPMNQVSIKQLFLYSFASQTSMLHIDPNTNKITDQEFDSLFEHNSYQATLDLIKSKCKLELQSKYPGNHINWWNQDKIFRMLKIAGFSEVYLSGYRQSFCPVMRDTSSFDNSHPELAIFVETIKV